MKYRKLGRTDIEISTVCMGCWSISTTDFFWDQQAREDSIAAIHAALETGVNFFDTAPVFVAMRGADLGVETLARIEIVIHPANSRFFEPVDGIGIQQAQGHTEFEIRVLHPDPACRFGEASNVLFPGPTTARHHAEPPCASRDGLACTG